MRISLAGAVVGMTLLSGCGGAEADIPAIEAELGDWANQQGLAAATVDCPTSVDWEVGGDFHCVITSAGQTYRVSVTMEDDQGTVTWALG